jgi:TatD DNase family protein
MIIDTHCHLNDVRYQEDIEEVWARAKQHGVIGALIPGADPRELPRAKALCEQHENLFFAVGVHPYDMELYDEALLREYASHPKCIAIGECGLDYFRLPKDEEEKEREKVQQKEIFRAQIRLAIALDKPLIIHIREASNDSKMILIEEEAKKVGGVLHCFNASETLLELDSHNFYFGIGGVVTFKNAKKLVEILPKIPQEKLLIETDGPYLTPHPHRGERNEPYYTTLISQKMAEILEIEQKKLEKIIIENTNRLFKDNFKLI